MVQVAAGPAAGIAPPAPARPMRTRDLTGIPACRVCGQRSAATTPAAPAYRRREVMRSRVGCGTGVAVGEGVAVGAVVGVAVGAAVGDDVTTGEEIAVGDGWVEVSLGAALALARAEVASGGEEPPVVGVPDGVQVAATRTRHIPRTDREARTPATERA